MPEVWTERVANFFRRPGRKAPGDAGGSKESVQRSLCPCPGSRNARGGDPAVRGAGGRLDLAGKGLAWRIYRLPGDREWWRLDHGPGSVVLFCKDWNSRPATKSVHAPSENPRAWIAVNGTLYLDGEVAEFV